MTHDAGLLMTLAVAFAAAFVGGLAASRLRLPPMVGYLVAGVAVGPFTPGPVANPRLAAELAEIGVILMMFGIGLHFSFRDLWAVRRIAVPGAVGQIAIATALGTALAWLWGWGIASGLVFGLALSVASTVVLLRALDDRGLVETPEGRSAVGWLIVEDLAMVLALVLLPALAHAAGTVPAAGHAAGAHLPAATSGGLAMAVAWTLAKVALFAVGMLVVGTRVFPWALAHVARCGSRELFTVAVLATSIGVAYFASGLFDISFALGAFFAGVVVGGSHLDRQVVEETVPLQDAFAVLFFVSVGMIVDPAVVLAAPGQVLAVLAVVLVGKSVAAVGLVWLLRYPLRTALVVAAGLAQVGEFSFILAEVGIELRLMTAGARDLILVAAISSIALNPLAFHLALRLSAWLAERPRYVARFQRGQAHVVAWRPGDGHPRDHVIVVGHDRTGAWIAGALREVGVRVVVVERRRAEAEALHALGMPVVFGDASRPIVLDLAGVAHARMLVITTAEAHDVRTIVAHARGASPATTIVAATHSHEEAEALQRLGADRVVLAEDAVAQAMVQAILTADAPTPAGPSEGAQG